MKVLWFSNTPALGIEFLYKKKKLEGTGGWMYSLNKHLQHNVELGVAFHYPYKKDVFNFEKSRFYPIYTGSIIFENLKKRFFGKVYDTDFLNQYLKIIEDVKPDIIHIHGTENAFLCILGKTNIPVVISIQGNLTVINQKFNSGFQKKYVHDKVGELSLKSLLFGRMNFYRGYKNIEKMSEIEQRHLKKVKFIIGRTDWDRRITRILAPESTYFVGNEMLRDSFYENTWIDNFCPNKLVLFTTNGNSYYKGFETLCHALNLLNITGINVEWRVAGVTTDSLINKITVKYLKDDYPEKGLLLLGSLDEKELVDNLKESNIYIMPSHIENSPNNLCEAMILGMPCIATFAGGTGSILIDGEEGILIQDGDPWAMAGAIIELKDNIAKAVQYGIAARQKALKRHNKNEIVGKLLENYKTIISSHP
jgi:glycosyltransferase involved in cell wall biosynthesis